MKILMKPFNELRPVQWLYDCERIVKATRNEGYELTLKQAEEMWENFSEAYCASWLILPESDEKLSAILFGESDYHDRP